MTGTAQRETPNVGIFWLAQTTDGEARLLASGCPLDQAELYGDSSSTGRAICSSFMPIASSCIKTQFHLPQDRTEITSDFHYQSNEIPSGL